MEQYLFGLTAELTVSDNSKADIVIFTTLLSFAVIISWVKYCNQPGRKAAWQWKREKVVDYTSSSSWGQAGSATRVRLLKPINGMAWSAPMYHCSATLCITSRANSMNSVKFFFFPFLPSVVASKGLLKGGWFPLVISVSFFDVYRQNLHSTQLGDNQTDTSNKSLVTMPKFPQKDSH